METKEGTLIELKKGAIVSKVVKKPFRVKTRFATFGVRGTQFFTSTSGDNDAWMCVKEGFVVVTKDKKKVEVPAGKGVFTDKKDISKPAAFAWTRKINWKMDASEGDLDHKVNLDYDILENFYD
jgi:ferric-dicitrate binding protein FerR (iron transport regulator)